MRRVYLIKPQSLSVYVIYDGVKTEKHRKEFCSLADLVDYVTDDLPGYKPKSKIEVYLENFNPEEERSIKLVLSKRLPKSAFPNRANTNI